MEEENRVSAASDRDGVDRVALSDALREVAAGIGEKQVKKIVALCDLKGLKRVFGDAELMRTAECFIQNSLNISAAARALYMHRNTMMYRLDKIKRLTGLDIRSFEEAVAFSLLYGVYSNGHGGER